MRIRTLVTAFGLAVLLGGSILLARGGKRGEDGPYFAAFIQVNPERDRRKVGMEYGNRRDLTKGLNALVADGYNVHAVMEIKGGRYLVICKR